MNWLFVPYPALGGRQPGAVLVQRPINRRGGFLQREQLKHIIRPARLGSGADCGFLEAAEGLALHGGSGGGAIDVEVSASMRSVQCVCSCVSKLCNPEVRPKPVELTMPMASSRSFAFITERIGPKNSV